MINAVNVAPKKARVLTNRKVFPVTPRTADNLTVQGGLFMPEDRTMTVYRHPNWAQKDTATQQPVTALQQQGGNSTQLVATIPDDAFGTHSVPEIQPHEKGTFFSRKVVPVQKTQFGASGDKSSDTAFHPRKKDVQSPPIVASAMMTATKKFLPSFPSNNNLWSDPNNSFLGGRHNTAGQGSGVGRWKTTKVGAGG